MFTTNGLFSSSPYIINEIFDKPIGSFTSLNGGSGFRIVGNGVSATGNYVNMTSGVATFTDNLVWTGTTGNLQHGYTCLEKWKQRVIVRTPTINSTSYGIGIGVDSYAAEEYSTSFRWIWDNVFNPGQVAMYTKRTTTNQVLSGAFLTPSSNTPYIIELERNKNVFTFTVFNISGTQLATTQFTTSLSTGYVQPHNTGRFCIQNFGGTNIRISGWTVTSKARKNINYVTAGDSNMAGLFAVTTGGRYVETAMNAKGKTFEILAGIADRSGDVVLRLPEILALKPKKVYLNILSNDIANGVSSGTYQANYDTIINTVTGASPTSISRLQLGTPVARNSDLTAAQTFINGKTSFQRIDLFAQTKNAGNTNMKTALNSGDGIHMSTSGNTVCSNTFLGII